MTNIEWTRNPDGSKGKSWNPIRARNKQTGKRGWFCAHVHDGCRFCYAERINMKAGDTGGNGVVYKAQNEALLDIYLDEETLLEPLHWRKPQRVFVCSMSDLYGPWVKIEWLDKIKAVQALTPQHTYIEPTKRPDRMLEYLTGGRRISESRFDDRAICIKAMAFLWGPLHRYDDVLKSAIAVPLPNACGLVSCSTQQDADKFIPILLQTPLAKRGVSLEPLLGPIDLTKIPHAHGIGSCLEPGEIHGGTGQCVDMRPALDWVIAGGESGTKEQDIRPMHPDWLRSLRDQCKAAGVPFFFKQWGEYLPVGQNLPGYGKVNGAFAVKLGRMKLHYAGPTMWGTNYAFAERGVEFASMTDGRLTFRVGKKRAGRLLDGVEHNEFPQQASS